MLEPLFVTELWQSAIDSSLIAELDIACRALAVDDEAGLKWCRKNGYPGYTSYASLEDLPWRFPAFRALAKEIDTQAKAFAKALEFDTKGKTFRLAGLWVNVMPQGGVHTGHIHPHAAISGTVYIALPKGASAIRFEDPRLGFKMAAPAPRKTASRSRQPFVTVEPDVGTLLMWESWLRHDVPLNRSEEPRISVSFNVAIE